MRRGIVSMALMAATVPALLGCGFAEIRSPVPEFMRAKASEPAPEVPPDVRQLVRERLDSMFVAASLPQQVRVSPPRREVNGPGWNACVAAETTSAVGKPLGTQTYRVVISGGVITDRRRSEAGDICGSESYEPI